MNTHAHALAFFTAAAAAAAATGCAATRPATPVEIRLSRLGGQLPVLPEDVRARQQGEALLSTYKVCLDLTSGTVQHVEPISGVAGADEAIMAALRTWTWLVVVPQSGGPRSVCFTERLRFSLGDKQAPPEVPPHLEDGFEIRLRDQALMPTPRSIAFRKVRAAGQEPRLPERFEPRDPGLRPPDVSAAYKVCADGESGQVSRVEPAPGLAGADEDLMAALRSWRYQVTWPAFVAEICFLERLQLKVRPLNPRPL
jgi:hypothetical protein